MRGRDQSPHAAMDGMGKTPEALRIEALMEIYGLPTQAAFAHAIGISAQRLNNVLTGSPLGKDMAFRILDRFPAAGLEWLWRGDPDAVRSAELQRKLREYERRRGVKLFR